MEKCWGSELEFHLGCLCCPSAITSEMWICLAFLLGSTLSPWSLPAHFSLILIFHTFFFFFYTHLGGRSSFYCCCCGLGQHTDTSSGPTVLEVGNAVSQSKQNQFWTTCCSHFHTVAKHWWIWGTEESAEENVSALWIQRYKSRRSCWVLWCISTQLAYLEIQFFICHVFLRQHVFCQSLNFGSFRPGSCR